MLRCSPEFLRLPTRAWCQRRSLHCLLRLACLLRLLPPCWWCCQHYADANLSPGLGLNRTFTRLSQLHLFSCLICSPLPRKMMVAFGWGAEGERQAHSCSVTSLFSSPFFEPEIHTCLCWLGFPFWCGGKVVHATAGCHLSMKVLRLLLHLHLTPVCRNPATLAVMRFVRAVGVLLSQKIHFPPRWQWIFLAFFEFAFMSAPWVSLYRAVLNSARALRLLTWQGCSGRCHICGALTLAFP